MRIRKGREMGRGDEERERGGKEFKGMYKKMRKGRCCGTEGGDWARNSLTFPLPPPGNFCEQDKSLRVKKYRGPPEFSTFVYRGSSDRRSGAACP